MKRLWRNILMRLSARRPSAGGTSTIIQPHPGSRLQMLSTGVKIMSSLMCCKVNTSKVGLVLCVSCWISMGYSVSSVIWTSVIHILDFPNQLMLFNCAANGIPLPLHSFQQIQIIHLVQWSSDNRGCVLLYHMHLSYSSKKPQTLFVAHYSLYFWL